MKVIVCCLSLLCCSLFSHASSVKSVSYQKLKNGISVVFIDTGTVDSVLIMMSVSAGSADEIESHGVANLLCEIISNRLKQQVNFNKLQYGVEVGSYTGYDQTVYYLYGKPENLNKYIKYFSDAICNFSCDEKMLQESKKAVYQKIKDDEKINKFDVQKSALSSLYWHAGYGYPITGESNDAELAHISSLNEFHKNNYKNNKITFFIVGRINQENTSELLQKTFSKNAGIAKINRLKEPEHHGSSVQIEKASEQIDTVMLNFYWKITPYSMNKTEALADEILVEYIENVLQKQLVNDLKIISAISSSHVSWNREHGHCYFSVTAPANADLDFIKTSVVASMKCLVSDGIENSEKVSQIKKKIINSANIYNMDAIDATDWISKRISAGYEWDFLMNFAKIGDKCDINLINKEAKKIFCKDPDVISIIKPKE